MGRELDAINIADKDITYIKIPFSGTYLVDGNIIDVNSYKTERIKCHTPDDVRLVTKSKYVIEYRSGGDTMTPGEYENQKYELRKKCQEYDDYEKWETLEDEFAYRKFINTWKPIYKEIQIISDPIKVTINQILYDTGIPYIKNAFLNGDGNDDVLYSYSQDQAWEDICKECFDELGMSFVGNVSYSKTANTKIWGNSTSGCIRYVTAFGTYIFGNTWGNPRVIKGTLQDVKARYEKDRENIRSIIKEQYNKHFGDIDAGRFDFESLLHKLKLASAYMRNLKVYSKSSSDYWHAMDQLTNAIDQINVAYNVVNEE